MAEAFDGWLTDLQGQVFVSVDETGEAVGMVRVVMLSATESWAQAARVHPSHRRKGLATQLSHAGEAWAREHGALVVRLVTEGWNEPAQRQVESAGFRPVSSWLMAERPVGEASPRVEGNGGRRAPVEERLRPATSAEAEPAFVAWSTGELVTASHGLFPAQGWMWRQLHLEDVAAAASGRTLWENPAGWLVGGMEEDLYRVGWLSTGPEDARRLVKAAIDLAAEHGAERLRFLIPRVDWLTRAVRRAGLETHPLLIYEKAVGEPGGSAVTA